MKGHLQQGFLVAICFLLCFSFGIVNDNYCDRLDGSDEMITSACSHISSNRLFVCPGTSAGYLNISIPFSRVSDGICDCCDGADEIHFTIPHKCNNTCDSILETLRHQAMATFKQVKAGRELRNSLVERVNRKRIQDERSLAQINVSHFHYQNTKFYNIAPKPALLYCYRRLGKY